jgi:thiol peroxidase
MAKTALKGAVCNTNSDLPAVGSKAPDFKLTTVDLKDVSLADYKGKRKLLNIVVSLDTSVCAASAKKFNDQIAGKQNVVVLVVSADLPFAQGRFCKAEKATNVVTLSMMRSRHFAKDYGVLLIDGPFEGITARSIVVLDESDKVVYRELVPEISTEPDYTKALSALFGK